MLCSVVYPGKFVAWITCLTSSYEDTLIAGMVKKGYIIGAAAAQGKVSVAKEDSPSAVIAITIDSYNENLKAADVYKDLVEVIADKKVICYSVIVTAQVDSSWGAANFNLPKKENPIVSEENKKLN